MKDSYHLSVVTRPPLNSVSEGLVMSSNKKLLILGARIETQ